MSATERKSECLIAFGSNRGDEESIFGETKHRLQEISGIESLLASQPFQTAPVGGPVSQPDFLNAAFRVQTSLSCTAMHQTLVRIETSLGRERRVRWGPRTLDLDLLLYDDVELETESLTIPHPRMSFRRFVLQPALEIAGDMRHPVSGLTIAELIRHLDSTPAVIVWATHIDAEVEQSRRQLLSNPSRADWQIHLVDQQSEFERLTPKAKLVAWGVDCPSELKSQGFRGPQLRLPDTVRRSTIELEAAMAAMER